MTDRFKFRVWNDMQKCYSPDDHYIDENGELNTDGKYIVEQCTGLKDKNGKLIYEGDIVQTDYENFPLDRYVYRWEAPSFYVEPIENGKLTGSHYYYYAICVERCVVIGNIHENPELLRSPNETDNDL